MAAWFLKHHVRLVRYTPLTELVLEELAFLGSKPSGIIWLPRTRTLAFGFGRRIHLGNPCTIGEVIWRCGFSLQLPLKAKRGLQTNPNHMGSLIAYSPGTRHPRPDAPKGRYPRHTDGIATSRSENFQLGLGMPVKEHATPSFQGPPFWGAPFLRLVT